MSHSQDGVQAGDEKADIVLNTYICTDPLGRSLSERERSTLGIDGLLEILQLSMDYFAEHRRSRIVERICFEMARINVLESRWRSALQVLLPIWPSLSWRKDGWFSILQHVDRLLRDCARREGDGVTLVAIEWELLCQREHDRQH